MRTAPYTDAIKDWFLTGVSSNYFMWGYYHGFLGDNSTSGASHTQIQHLEAHTGQPVEIVMIAMSLSLGNPNVVNGHIGSSQHLYLQVPLTPNNSTYLPKTNDGTNDHYFQALVASIIAANLDMKKVTIVLGWEFGFGNVGSFQWSLSATNTIALYNSSFRRVVGVMRTAGFTGTFMVDQSGMTASQISAGVLYPGDDVVDMIGYHCYNSCGATNQRDSESLWWGGFMKPHLDACTALAVAHGKLCGASEMGQLVAPIADTTSNTYKFHTTDNTWYWSNLHAYFLANCAVWAGATLFNEDLGNAGTPSASFPTTEYTQIYYFGTDPATQNHLYLHDTNQLGTVYDTNAVEHTISSAAYVRSVMVPGTMQSGGGGFSVSLSDTAHATDGVKVKIVSPRSLNDSERKNLIANPSLEVDLGNWVVTASTGGTITRDTTLFRTGVASGKWNPGSVLGSLEYYSVPAEYHGSYTASCWLYVPSASGVTNFSIQAVQYQRVNNSGFLLADAASFSVTVHDAWFRVSVPGSVLGSTAAAIGFKLVPTGSGVFYWDDAQLESGSSVTTYFESDSVARPLSYSSSLADTAVATDSLISHLGHNRALSDIATLSDALTRYLFLVTVFLGQSLTVTDGVTHALSAPRALTDSVPSMSDVLVGQKFRTRALTETLTTSDVLTQHSNRAFSFISDDISTTFNDGVLSRLTSGPRLLADTAGALDSLVGQHTVLRLLGDAAAGTDALSRGVFASRSSADVAPAVDAGTRGLLSPRSLGDIANGFDVLTYTRLIRKGISESTVVSEVVARTLGLARGLAESTALSDAVVRVATHPRSVAEALFFTEVVARSPAFQRSLADTTSLVDSLQRALRSQHGVADSVTGTDALGRALGALRAQTELLTLADVIRGSLSSVHTALLDVTTVSDAVTRSRVQNRATADTTSVSDALLTLLVHHIFTTDTTATQDSLVRVLVTSRNTADYTVLEEALLRVITGLLIGALDALSPPQMYQARQALLSITPPGAQPGRTMLLRP